MTELVGGVFSPGFPGTQSFAGLLGMRKGRREAGVGTSAVTCVGSSVVGPRLGSRRGLSWSRGPRRAGRQPWTAGGSAFPRPFAVSHGTIVCVFTISKFSVSQAK